MAGRKGWIGHWLTSLVDRWVDRGSGGATAIVETFERKQKAEGYPVGLVGEQHYQEAARGARIGGHVQVLSEPSNPQDPLALVVCDAEGRTLGYLPRDSWLHAALGKEKKGCRATIKRLDRGSRGFVEVVIEVTLTMDGPIGKRDFVPAQ